MTWKLCRSNVLSRKAVNFYKRHLPLDLKSFGFQNIDMKVLLLLIFTIALPFSLVNFNN